MPEYHAMRALELVREAQSGRVSAQELAEYFLRRIERYDQSLGLNAVGELNPQALDEAKALEENASPRDFPLFGLPILVKDNIDVAGLHTTAGSPALADNLARRDAPIVANLRRAGAVVLGKTHMTEFANYTALDMPNGYSALAGQVHSAYGAQCDPGGSSTGSAVAVSAGFCAVAIGTDTSFSIVGCAAEHGIVGLKPACGALISAGIVPISRTLDSAGPMARDVASALAVYAAMRRACDRLHAPPGARIAPGRELGGRRSRLRAADRGLRQFRARKFAKSSSWATSRAWKRSCNANFGRIWRHIWRSTKLLAKRWLPSYSFMRRTPQPACAMACTICRPRWRRGAARRVTLKHLSGARPRGSVFFRNSRMWTLA